MYSVHHLLNRTTARGLGFIALLFMLAFKVEDKGSKKKKGKKRTAVEDLTYE